MWTIATWLAPSCQEDVAGRVGFFGDWLLNARQVYVIDEDEDRD
jgi:hypothetical protein